MFHFNRFAAACGIAFVCLVGIVGPANAQTITQSTVTGQAGFGGGQATLGESVTPLNTRLDSYTFFISASPSVTVVGSVYLSNASGTAVVGAPLWTSAPQTLTNATYDPVTFTPNLAVSTTDRYVLLITATAGGGGANIAGDVYPGGQVFFGVLPTLSTFAGQDMTFNATFSAAPAPPASIPTMTEWAMIGLTLTLAGGGALMLSRRRRLSL